MSRRIAGAALFSILLTGLLVGCAEPRTTDPEPPRETIPFRKDGRLTFIQEGEEVVSIDIEVAETDSSRNRGLMGRPSLPDRSGMLFVFEQPGLQQFYMANTLMSLDFFFVGPDSVIVNTVKYASPLSLDGIFSSGPAQWVVEVEAGFIDNWGIVAGDRVAWSRE